MGSSGEFDFDVADSMMDSLLLHNLWGVVLGRASQHGVGTRRVYIGQVYRTLTDPIRSFP